MSALARKRRPRPGRNGISAVSPEVSFKMQICVLKRQPVVAPKYSQFARFSLGSCVRNALPGVWRGGRAMSARRRSTQNTFSRSIQEKVVRYEAPPEPPRRRMSLSSGRNRCATRRGRGGSAPVCRKKQARIGFSRPSRSTDSVTPSDRAPHG
jgi:hypothetical protein